MDQWIIQVDQNLGNRRRLQSRQQEEERQRANNQRDTRRCIYRIPAHVWQNQDDDDYRPRRVSFGPYYHNDERCRPTETDKEAALLHFLMRSTSNRPLRDYKVALLRVVESLKAAYDQLNPYWQQDTDAFLQMMILDGCFLLEILQGASNPLSYYAPDNPVLRIYENHSKMEDFKHDMLLLENQLPMLLLAWLLHVQERKLDPPYNEVSLTIFSKRPWSVCPASFLHILDASRPLCSKYSNWDRHDKSLTLGFSIPSATELQEAGIRFKANFRTSEMSFRRRTLMLPGISVDGARSRALFLNTIAFEKLHKKAGTIFTSYIYFMQCLIRSANDVSLLQSRGIIKSPPPDDEIARLFHGFSEDLLLLNLDSLDYNYLVAGELLRERFDWIVKNEWRKDLFQKYLTSPWTIISVIAASLLLILTMVQTVYSILSYRKK